MTKCEMSEKNHPKVAHYCFSYSFWFRGWTDYHIINGATLHRKSESQNADELSFAWTDIEKCVDYQVGGNTYTGHLDFALYNSGPRNKWPGKRGCSEKKQFEKRRGST